MSGGTIEILAWHEGHVKKRMVIYITSCILSKLPYFTSSAFFYMPAWD